jgi:hypothetical protein
LNTMDASSKPIDKSKSRRPPATSSILNGLIMTSSRDVASNSTALGSIQTSASQPSVGQSIVLIEEADVLFKDDLNFWATVKSIIKECHRPVIITCNGKSIVHIPAHSHGIRQTLLLCRQESFHCKLYLNISLARFR